MSLSDDLRPILRQILADISTELGRIWPGIGPGSTTCGAMSIDPIRGPTHTCKKKTPEAPELAEIRARFGANLRATPLWTRGLSCATPRSTSNLRLPRMPLGTPQSPPCPGGLSRAPRHRQASQRRALVTKAPSSSANTSGPAPFAARDTSVGAVLGGTREPHEVDEGGPDVGSPHVWPTPAQNGWTRATSGSNWTIRTTLCQLSHIGGL